MNQHWPKVSDCSPCYSRIRAVIYPLRGRQGLRDGITEWQDDEVAIDPCYAAANMKRDPWTEQDDLVERLRNPEGWLQGLVPIHVETRSYVEDFYWTAVLLPLRYAATTLTDFVWADDLAKERFRLIHPTSSNFLSRAVRTRLHLNNAQRDYMVDKQIVADRRLSTTDFHPSDTIRMSYESLTALASTPPRSALLWCFRAFRFTERRLDELCMRASPGRTFRGESFVYMRRAFNVVRGPLLSRPRMRSGTLIMGKLLVVP
jgi:hypothetical protein